MRKALAKSSPFTSRCGSARFVRSAQPLAIQCSALGARTGRALRNCFTRSDCIPFDVPLARILRGGDAFGRCRWSAIGTRPGRPCHISHWHQLWLCPSASLPEGPTPMGKHSLGPKAPSPEATRQRTIKSFALGSCARSLAVRAPVRAPKEKPSLSHWLSAPHKRRATALACEREALRPILSRPSACERQIAKRPRLLWRARHRYAKDDDSGTTSLLRAAMK